MNEEALKSVVDVLVGEGCSSTDQCEQTARTAIHAYLTRASGGDELVERLREPFISDAFAAGTILSGELAERLILERKEVISALTAHRAEIAELTNNLSLTDDLYYQAKAAFERAKARVEELEGALEAAQTDLKLLEKVKECLEE